MIDGDVRDGREPRIRVTGRVANPGEQFDAPRLRVGDARSHEAGLAELRSDTLHSLPPPRCSRHEGAAHAAHQQRMGQQDIGDAETEMPRNIHRCDARDHRDRREHSDRNGEPPERAHVLDDANRFREREHVLDRGFVGASRVGSALGIHRGADGTSHCARRRHEWNVQERIRSGTGRGLGAFAASVVMPTLTKLLDTSRCDHQCGA